MGAKILATAVSIVAMARASFSDCFIASRLGTSSPKISVKYDRITVIRKIEMIFSVCAGRGTPSAVRPSVRMPAKLSAA